MSNALWHDDGDGWSLLAPAGFPSEADLHDCVERAPDLLPLSGSPRLLVLGREVTIGSGSADLIAIESEGRLVVIEVKLRSNSESRKAVVSQILTYAAGVYGLTYQALERDILGAHLARLGHDSLVEAVRANDQGGDFDLDTFKSGISASLEQGRIRLVLVLDEAPADLIRLVGYLEAVAPGLVIDLITVASYRVGDSHVLVPQRIDAGRDVKETAPIGPHPTRRSIVTPGADGFREWITQAPERDRAELRRLLNWAIELERDGLATLATTHAVSGECFLRPFLLGERRGAVTIWHNTTMAVWPTVMERRSPEALARLRSHFAPAPLPTSFLRGVEDEVLSILTAAYAEAAAQSAGAPAAISDSL
jgi:hypothetical protein